MKRLYSIFDTVAKDSLAPFVANNDDHAILMVKNSIKSHQFDRLSLPDCQLVCLCGFNTDDCVIYSSKDEYDFNRVVTCLDDILDSDDKQQMYLIDFLKDLTKTFSNDVKKAVEDLTK